MQLNKKKNKYGTALISYPSFFCSLLIKKTVDNLSAFFILSIAISSFFSYSLHCEIKTGNTFLIIGNNKHAIHNGFRGRRGHSLTAQMAKWYRAIRPYT